MSPHGTLAGVVPGGLRLLPVLYPWLLVLSALLAGCSLGQPPSPRHVYFHRVPPGGTFDLLQGRPLPNGELGARLKGAQLVFVGEIHDEPRSHRFEEEVVRTLVQQGKAVTVALEMLPPSADGALRAWSEGRSSELELLQQTDWYETWGFPWPTYRDLFAAFRELRLPVHGINVTLDQRLAAREGELTPDLRRELDALDLTLEPHQAYLLDALGEVGHGNGLSPDSPIFKTYQRVQVLWDQVMGLRAARLAAESYREHGEKGVVVVLIGSGHLAFKLGANLRAARTEPYLAQLTVVDRVVGADELDPQGRYPLEVGIADLARVYLAHPREPALPSLAALKLADDPAGARVKAVMRHGAGALAAFQEGDVILSLNGQPAAGAIALRLAFESLPPGAKAEFTVQRGGKPVVLSVVVGRDKS